MTEKDGGCSVEYLLNIGKSGNLQRDAVFNIHFPPAPPIPKKFRAYQKDKTIKDAAAKPAQRAERGTIGKIISEEEYSARPEFKTHEKEATVQLMVSDQGLDEGKKPMNRRERREEERRQKKMQEKKNKRKAAETRKSDLPVLPVDASNPS